MKNASTLSESDASTAQALSMLKNQMEKMAAGIRDAENAIRRKTSRGGTTLVSKLKSANNAQIGKLRSMLDLFNSGVQGILSQQHIQEIGQIHHITKYIFVVVVIFLVNFIRFAVILVCQLVIT